MTLGAINAQTSVWEWAQPSSINMVKAGKGFRLVGIWMTVQGSQKYFDRL